jgi:hypothetical protein
VFNYVVFAAFLLVAACVGRFISLATHAEEQADDDLPAKIETRNLPDMSTAKIPTTQAAEKAVIQKVISDPDDGLSSTHGPAAKLAFVLGFDVPDFGKRGDRVWQVHFVALTGESARIAWVNAETGKVVFLMEDKDTRTED